MDNNAVLSLKPSHGIDGVKDCLNILLPSLHRALQGPFLLHQWCDQLRKMHQISQHVDERKGNRQISSSSLPCWQTDNARSYASSHSPPEFTNEYNYCVFFYLIIFYNLKLDSKISFKNKFLCDPLICFI